MMIPKPGTPEHDRFIERASRPGTLEHHMVRAAQDQASKQVGDHLKNMLDIMIELVPGQIFRDVLRFSEKFGLEPTREPGHELPEDVVEFRAHFMAEELREYLASCGIKLEYNIVRTRDEVFDVEGAFDSLIDLVYVAVGTAILHRFPFNEGWSRVQAANMAKARAESANDGRSKRKHSLDVVKPEGWKPPVLSDLLDARAKCQACGSMADYRLPGEKCPICGGLYHLAG